MEILLGDTDKKLSNQEETFNKLTQTIEEAEDYMGMQTSKFRTMVTDIKDEVK